MVIIKSRNYGRVIRKQFFGILYLTEKQFSEKDEIMEMGQDHIVEVYLVADSKELISKGAFTEGIEFLEFFKAGAL
jgi:hypothetical protein